MIECICDKDSFLEVQKDFAKNIVVGYARINGESVGIVANQPMVLAGSLDYDASDKAARFIRTCDCYNVPLVVLVDVSALCRELHRNIKESPPWSQDAVAFSEATVPKISVIMRKAYGGAYIAMTARTWEQIWSMLGREQRLLLWEQKELLTLRSVVPSMNQKTKKQHEHSLFRNIKTSS